MLEAPETGIAVRPSGYREYTPELKAAVLSALEVNEGNLTLTARQFNIPFQTVQSWEKGVGVSENVLNIQRGVKGPLADQFEVTARLYLEHAQKPEVIEKTSGYYATVGASDAMRSAQLLRGQPTSITGNVMSEDERKLRLVELLVKLAPDEQGQLTE